MAPRRVNDSGGAPSRLEGRKIDPGAGQPREDHMPITLVRDDAARTAVATGEGAFRPDDIFNLLETLRHSGAWAYGVILDLRRMTGPTNVADLKRIRDITSPISGPDDRRGPLAIVATVEGLYAMACAYAALSGHQGRVGVFRERVEADQWLAAQMAG